MTNRVTTKLNDGTHGLFISKPSVDVLTADPWNLIFDSRLSYFGSVYQQGTSSRGQTVTFPSLGYVPMVICFITTGSTVSQFIEYRSTATLQVYYDSTSEGGVAGQARPNSLYHEHYLVEPIYRVTQTSLEFVDDYTTYYDPSGGYSVRYLILRVPGGS